MTEVIDLQNVEFRYPTSPSLVIQIPNLQIKKGERVFLFGPSGSGKTTLLEILAGVLCPQNGRVGILDTDIARLSSSQRDFFRGSHLGYIFQSFNLIPYLSVKENILLPVHLNLERKARLAGRNLDTEVDRICQRLGILDLITRPVTQLSVGQQQRVAVARALLGGPGLILADEPTSSLDYDHREKFIKLLFDVCDETGTTVLFVSHDRSLEKIFSRSVSFMDINKANRS